MAKVISYDGNYSGNYGNRAYRTINGKTFMYPINPDKQHNTPRCVKIMAATMGLINLFVNNHYGDIKECFNKGTRRSPRNAFIHENIIPFREALYALAERALEGERIELSEVEAAIATYATAHPQSIIIGKMSGYKPIFLTGSWPATMSFMRYDMDHSTKRFQQPDGSFSSSPNGENAEVTTPAAGDIVITAVASPSNGGTVTGGGSYANGANVTLRAEAANGFIFSGWSDGISTASRTITVNGATTYTAMFTAASNDEPIGE